MCLVSTHGESNFPIQEMLFIGNLLEAQQWHVKFENIYYRSCNIMLNTAWMKLISYILQDQSNTFLSTLYNEQELKYSQATDPNVF